MHTVKMNGIHYSLTDIEKDCWRRLLNGALKSKDALHNPTVANINIHGVNLRTVVLRKVVTAQKTLTFHTDVRSGKWKELSENDSISWLFYDAGARIQIRLSGKTSLHNDDDIANEAWLHSTANSRKVYTGNIAPTQISEMPTSGLSTNENDKATIEKSEAGRENFGLVITKVNWMEWLWLNSEGHCRASFTYNDEKSIVANWLVP